MMVVRRVDVKGGRYPRTDSYSHSFSIKNLDGLNNFEGSSLVSEMCEHFRISPWPLPSCEKSLETKGESSR